MADFRYTLNDFGLSKSLFDADFSIPTMILDEIIAHKREEVAIAKKAMDMRLLQDLLVEAPTARSFAKALIRDDGRMGLIAEIKKASPSAGVIQADFDPVKQAKAYEQAGADCLSILTDERFFQGHLDYLRAGRMVVKLPILRKDFTIDLFQIYEARAAGADAILLIVAALSKIELEDFLDASAGLGMSTLVEVHTAEEMEIALEIGASLIGINSRNLKTFEVDLKIIEQLAPMAVKEATLVGESGIKTATDVKQLQDAGISAILVGETLMRSNNIANAVYELLNLRELTAH